MSRFETIQRITGRVWGTISLAFVGVCVFAQTPAPTTAAPPVQPASVSPQAPPAPTGGTEQSLPYRVPLHRRKAGVFVVSIVANNKPYTFVLDTGATATVFDTSRVRPAEFGVGGKTTARAAGLGGIITIRLVVLKSLRIGEYAMTNYRVAFVDLSSVNKALGIVGDPPVDGVLGEDFLIRHRAVIDIGNSELRFYPPPSAENTAPPTSALKPRP